MSNPLAPIAKLRDRVAAAVAARGLKLQEFAVIPGSDPEGPHHARFVLAVDEDWKGDDTAVSDPDFERVMREAELAEQEEKARKAREGLESLREDLNKPGGGIGLD